MVAALEERLAAIPTWLPIGVEAQLVPGGALGSKVEKEPNREYAHHIQNKRFVLDKKAKIIYFSTHFRKKYVWIFPHSQIPMERFVRQIISLRTWEIFPFATNFISFFLHRQLHHFPRVSSLFRAPLHEPGVFFPIFSVGFLVNTLSEFFFQTGHDHCLVMVMGWGPSAVDSVCRDGDVPHNPPGPKGYPPRSNLPSKYASHMRRKNIEFFPICQIPPPLLIADGLCRAFHLSIFHIIHNVLPLISSC